MVARRSKMGSFLDGLLAVFLRCAVAQSFISCFLEIVLKSKYDRGKG